MRHGNSKLNDDLEVQIVNRWRSGEKTKDIAASLGLSNVTVWRLLKRLASEGTLIDYQVLPGFEITKITSKDEDGTITTQKPEAKEFDLPAGHILERTTQKIGDDWYKTKLSQAVSTKEDLLEIFAEYRGKAELIQPYEITFTSSLITVYPMSDLHLGMLAWGKETGTPWDLKIAYDTIFASMVELIQCSPPSNTAVLLDLGDYTHNNNQNNITPGHGHQLDVDGRFRKIAKEAMRLRKDLIELLLQKHNTVVVRALPGNHDPDVAGIIAAAFSLFFENNPRVQVDDDPSELWSYEFGVNMFCGNHGHKIKPPRLPGIMAARWPEKWGRTKVRQAWSGHIHHEKSGEDNGAKWLTLRTPAPADSYVHSHGFTAGRELTSWTYHITRGFRQKQVVEIL